MTTPARKLAEEFTECCHGGYRDEDLVRSHEDVIAWLLDKQRDTLDGMAARKLMVSGDFASQILSLWGPHGKYGPPRKPVTKDERIAKLRRALRHCALREKGTDRDIRDLVNAALREDDEEGE